MITGDGAFPRSLRLLRPSEFASVYAHRRSAAEGPLVLYARPTPTPGGNSRLGLSVSRRVGGAVVRNAWKRRLREVFRTVRSRLPPGQDFIVVVRPAKLPCGREGLESLERALIGLAGRIVSRPGYASAAGPEGRAAKPRHRPGGRRGG